MVDTNIVRVLLQDALILQMPDAVKETIERCIGLLEGDEPTVFDDSFEYLWNLYQKKTGKQKAMKLWSKLSKKDKRDCIAYVPLYVEAQPDKQYRKNLETFLRNKCWNDELIYRRNDGQTPEQRIARTAARINQIRQSDPTFTG